MYRVDIQPYKVPVKREVIAEDDFDVRGSIPQFLWDFVALGKVTVGIASEIEAILDRLEQLPPDAESVELTDREWELCMEAHGATKGPPRNAMGFLRRFSQAKQESVDERGAII